MHKRRPQKIADFAPPPPLFRICPLLLNPPLPPICGHPQLARNFWSICHLFLRDAQKKRQKISEDFFFLLDYYYYFFAPCCGRPLSLKPPPPPPVPHLSAFA